MSAICFNDPSSSPDRFCLGSSQIHMMSVTEQNNAPVMMGAALIFPPIISLGLMLRSLSYRQSSRLKVSPNLSSYEPYAGSVPKFLPCIKESVLQVHQSTRILPAVLRTAYVHFVFQQTKSCISMRKSSRCSLLDGEMRPLTPRYVQNHMNAIFCSSKKTSCLDLITHSSAMLNIVTPFIKID